MTIKQLLEDSRSDLIRRSKRGDDYKNQNKGRNRYERRTRSSVSKSVRQFNKIDMNKLFKDNIIEVGIEVQGETNNYIVLLSWGGFLSSLKLYLERNDSDVLDLRVITRALVDSFNHNDVYIHCSCPDWKFRMDYWSHLNGIASTERPDDPLDRPSDITNPNDTKGAGCKHTLLVLNNTSWMVKVASVVTNYIRYMEKHKEDLYAKIIYPAIFEKEYEEPTQIEIDEPDELSSGEDEIDTSNAWAREKTRFKPGNEYRFKSNQEENDTLDNQKQFDLDSLVSD